MMFVEILKAIFIGIVQGITEWLPVSSTGHMIIANEFINLNVSPGCWELFEVITQLGSIIAVIFIFFDKLNPWSKNKDAVMRKRTWSLWFKVIVAKKNENSAAAVLETPTVEAPKIVEPEREVPGIKDKT